MYWSGTLVEPRTVRLQLDWVTSSFLHSVVWASEQETDLWSPCGTAPLKAAPGCGAGRRLFDGAAHTRLSLIEARPTRKGNVLLTYGPREA